VSKEFPPEQYGPTIDLFYRRYFVVRMLNEREMPVCLDQIEICCETTEIVLRCKIREHYGFNNRESTP
jgi:hypothetical protein